MPTRAIFNDIVTTGWSGKIGDSSSPYEYFCDRIRDNYDVTLEQCALLCKMLKKYYCIEKFYYGVG